MVSRFSIGLDVTYVSIITSVFKFYFYKNLYLIVFLYLQNTLLPIKKTFFLLYCLG